ARGKLGAAGKSAGNAGILTSRPLAYAATVLSIIALAAAAFYFVTNPEQPPQTQRAQRPAPAKAPPPLAPSSIPVTQPEVATAPAVVLPEAASIPIVSVPPMQAAPSPVQQAP